MRLASDKLIRSMLHLIYPKLCLGCGTFLNQQEDYLCLLCEYDLPKFEEIPLHRQQLAKTFWGRVPFIETYAFLRLEDANLSQKMLHHLKYEKDGELGVYLGKKYGDTLQALKRFRTNKPDFLCPAPLHPRKMRQRGYNQSEEIAKGISDSIRIPCSLDLVKRIHYNKSQTTRNRIQRWNNSEKIFSLKENTTAFEGKHIAIVDDVVTTGATVEALSEQLLKIPKIQLSLISLAFTS